MGSNHVHAILLSNLRTKSWSAESRLSIAEMFFPVECTLPKRALVIYVPLNGRKSIRIYGLRIKLGGPNAWRLAHLSGLARSDRSRYACSLRKHITRKRISGNGNLQRLARARIRGEGNAHSECGIQIKWIDCKKKEDARTRTPSGKSQGIGLNERSWEVRCTTRLCT